MTDDTTRHEILIPLPADAAWRLFTQRFGDGADDYRAAARP
ncbi:hypothetical protein [Thiohalocapsa halophila]|jgi:hypothetical protein